MSTPTDELDVRHYEYQCSEKEWYFCVKEPESRGVYRRGFGCYISKDIPFEQAKEEALNAARLEFAAMIAAPLSLEEQK